MKQRTLLTSLLVTILLCSSVINVQLADAQGNCPDAYEPNNEIAAQLSLGQYRAAVCYAGDKDYYQFSIVAGKNVVSLSNLPADYDLYVYSANAGELIGESTNGGTDSEIFRWTAQKDDVVYVAVIPYGDAWSNSQYVLTVGRFPSFRLPVTGLGEGMITPIGSLAHRGPDLYALDYAYYDQRYANQYEGTDIYPVLPGKVVFSGYENDYGYTVVVAHWNDKEWDKKFYSIYAHLMKDGLPSLNTLVDGTRPIGRMGRTGNGSNNIVHLHFAVRYSNDVYTGLKALYGKNISTALDVRGLFR